MKKGLVWIRRDIRLHDHPALSASLADNDVTYIAFVFDSNILAPLKKRDSSDKRLQFIAESLYELDSTLKKHSSSLIVYYGDPVQIIPKICHEKQIDTLYFNRDYSPYPIKRDATVQQLCELKDVKVKDFQDHVMFEPQDILTKEGKPYNVFTPYSRMWLSSFAEQGSTVQDFTVSLAKLANDHKNELNSVNDFLKYAGFSPKAEILLGGKTAAFKQLEMFTMHLDNYHVNRDFPALDKTSKCSVYIRHGCLSIRDMLRVALSSKSKGAQVWLNELIWREFYQMILFHYPHCKSEAFNPKYKDLQFPGSEELLAAWKVGQTGYPIIDAAMRCLNETGWMHNRLRMIVASFFCKILLLDWRRGERYFAWKLLDYECASNNGGWQWSSSTGCDAAPYFRIFNPFLQSKKFDAQGHFIRKYCPELVAIDLRDVHNPVESKQLPFNFVLGKHYPLPIVDYKSKRQEALELFKKA